MPFTALIVRLWKRGKGSPLRVGMPQGILTTSPLPLSVWRSAASGSPPMVRSPLAPASAVCQRRPQASPGLSSLDIFTQSFFLLTRSGSFSAKILKN